MSKEIVITKESEGLMTTSKVIADVFDKPHRDVTKAIVALDCSEEFSARNFSQSEYKTERGKTYSCYDITEKGFYMLAMGFTGKKACTWKESFINEFERLRSGSAFMEELNDLTKKSECDKTAVSIAGSVLSKYKKVAPANKKLCDEAYEKVQLSLGFEG